MSFPEIRESNLPDMDTWETMLRADGYDLVFTIDITTGQFSMLYVGKRAYISVQGCDDTYEDLCNHIVSALVAEERESFKDNFVMSSVIAEIKERGCFVRTMHVETENGKRAKVCRISPYPADFDRLFCSVFDIAAELDHDWMTDEYARSGFIDASADILKELPANETFSLIYTNVRGFKAINELFGDQSGDMVIFQTRDALRKSLMPLILGRLEADHFVLIVKDSLLTDQRLNRLCYQTYVTGYKEYDFEIRLGIYRITEANMSVTHMIDRAKLAEKSNTSENGTPWAYYDDEVRTSYVRGQELLSDIKRALDTEEFETHYQPVVDAHTGSIIGSEALIRWAHHSRGLISPAEFIPVIENAGRISVLDRYMFERVIDFKNVLVASGIKPVPCSVNLSRLDFYDHEFMELIYSRVRDDKNLKNLLRFEVTESAYADLEKNAMDFLNELKSGGVPIYLDDFGSGMSSLSTLESFHFDVIKLDMGFVHKIGKRANAEAIISATIRLSHDLGAKVTAEGVETEEQVAFLRDAGVDYIQGYYFYKPMPEDDFRKVLTGRGDQA